MENGNFKIIVSQENRKMRILKLVRVRKQKIGIFKSIVSHKNEKIEFSKLSIKRMEN